MRYVIYLFFTVLLVLSGCTKKPHTEFYFIVVEDLHGDKTWDSQFPIAQVCESNNDTTVITDALYMLSDILLKEVVMANSSEYSPVKISAHKFVITIFREDGSEVPLENYAFKDTIESIFSRSEWLGKKEVKAARDFYMTNTNLFDSVPDLSPDILSSDPRRFFDPTLKIRIERNNHPDKETSYPQIDSTGDLLKSFVIKSIVLIVVVIWIFVLLIKRDLRRSPYAVTKFKGNRPRPILSMLNRDGDLNEDCWVSEIAGTEYRYNKTGGFCGWIENDSENTYNKRSMGIYNADGRLLGYIPECDLNNYRWWCKGQPVPCVGVLYKERGGLKGKVYIALPCNEEFLNEAFGQYMEVVKVVYGPEYLPRPKSIKFKTK